MPESSKDGVQVLIVASDFHYQLMHLLDSALGRADIGSRRMDIGTQLGLDGSNLQMVLLLRPSQTHFDVAAKEWVTKEFERLMKATRLGMERMFFLELNPLCDSEKPEDVPEGVTVFDTNHIRELAQTAVDTVQLSDLSAGDLTQISSDFRIFHPEAGERYSDFQKIVNLWRKNPNSMVMVKNEDGSTIAYCIPRDRYEKFMKTH